MSNIEHILSLRAELGEGPLWSPAEATLYLLDILNHKVHRYTPASNSHHTTTFPTAVTALGLRDRGGFIVANRDGFATWDGQSPHLEQLHSVTTDRPGARMNDGEVGPGGRFWAGSMTHDSADNDLYRLDPDHTLHKMVSGVTISNGLGWNPAEDTLYFADTLTYKIFAYDYDMATGAISNRRVFADCEHEPDGGYPDGLTVDSEGGVWSARWGGAKLVRYTPDGQVDRELPLPVDYPTSCAFGGADLRTLFITSAQEAISPDERDQFPVAGDLFAVDVGIAGRAPYRFKG